LRKLPAAKILKITTPQQRVGRLKPFNPISCANTTGISSIRLRDQLVFDTVGSGILESQVDLRTTGGEDRGFGEVTMRSRDILCGFGEHYASPWGLVMSWRHQERACFKAQQEMKCAC